MDIWWDDLRSADVGRAAALPDAERARLEELDEPADRGRRLLGALLLQEALRTTRGLPPGATVELDRTCETCGGPHGRPRAADGMGPYLSVSHSGLLVAVAASYQAAVGVDVQRTAAAGKTWDWVVAEARFKAGLPEGAGVVLRLDPPLAGYTAALAVAADEAQVVHHR
ncbi:4'-phosphopantetheinyl transferase family protein [Tessaracoccus sp. Y36]